MDYAHQKMPAEVYNQFYKHISWSISYSVVVLGRKNQCQLKCSYWINFQFLKVFITKLNGFVQIIKANREPTKWGFNCSNIRDSLEYRRKGKSYGRSDGWNQFNSAQSYVLSRFRNWKSISLHRKQYEFKFNFHTFLTILNFQLLLYEFTKLEDLEIFIKRFLYFVIYFEINSPIPYYCYS